MRFLLAALFIGIAVTILVGSTLHGLMALGLSFLAGSLAAPSR